MRKVRPVLAQRPRWPPRVAPPPTHRPAPPCTDPAAREAFDDYLEGFLEAREEDKAYDEESNYLDHLSTTVEVYCEESQLSGEVQERIVQRLETAYENWTAVDAALEADEIDHRELVERHGRIEEAVTSEMTELLGEEAWEELAGRIW